ncbi:hypothetical protein PVOR_19499 [Paenibacillus vortex V453]|jgi:hypothetical protein|uniref:DUF2642 domain-containing protein n=2 Tax=Paenibacillus TaxID=44249 RepID=A0A163M467_9BACL|nr:MULTISPECIES: hypothetical protein [Paenibacillus]ANA82665.1 hypothetical protein A3958_23000 [Paenibacillus glucanolyticus]AVV58595.1 hypothetical protein C7121_21980 [Paenibacillus glucanolyticus]AWP27782.1 hypothetical protein B9D94_14660 [Paenibacillus sp. Cedars]EFU40318.1 hypothetical protein PVOR_19499 [Paenibacillus vortex V453]ETT39717.1 hypothetical protein C169_09073 [Paenibacillus sp. FSL R5-808]
MDFSEILATFIGRTVEIIQTNQFLQGQLRSATDGFITVEVVSSNYIPTSQVVTVLNESISFVRILPL